MKTKILIRCLILSMMLLSCEEVVVQKIPKNEVTFTFTLYCSEDLLKFVIPTITYVDADGAETVEELKLEQFSKKDTMRLAGLDEAIVYKWMKVITISETKPAQRDMLVEYKIRGDAPVIDSDETYMMIHQLEGGYKKVDGVSVTYDVSTYFEVTIDGDSSTKIPGKKMLIYLENLISTPDYKFLDAR